MAEFFDLPIEAVVSPRPFAPLGAQVYANASAQEDRRLDEAGEA